MTRVDPPLWLETPRGIGLAHFVIDYGVEVSLHWVVAIADTGECWTFTNEDIRFPKNYTMHRRTDAQTEQTPPVSPAGPDVDSQRGT